jgi:hypothetical protein
MDGDIVDYDLATVAGYGFSPSMIYMDFRWSQADAAYNAVRRLAKAHGVGLYDVSGDLGEIVLPDAPLAHPPPGVWSKVQTAFQAGGDAVARLFEGEIKIETVKPPPPPRASGGDEL